MKIELTQKGLCPAESETHASNWRALKSNANDSVGCWFKLLILRSIFITLVHSLWDPLRLSSVHQLHRFHSPFQELARFLASEAQIDGHNQTPLSKQQPALSRPPSVQVQSKRTETLHDAYNLQFTAMSKAWKLQPHRTLDSDASFSNKISEPSQIYSRTLVNISKGTSRVTTSRFSSIFATRVVDPPVSPTPNTFITLRGIYQKTTGSVSL